MTAQDTPAQTPEREVTKVDTISSTEAHSSDASAKGEVAGKMPSQNPESSSSVLAPSGAANIPATENAKQPHWLTTEGTHSIPDNNMYIVLPGLMLAVFLAALDQTIVSTALPTISVELNAGPSGYAWVGTAYLLTATALIPLYGRLSDLTGRKPLLWVAIVFFLFGSALCGAAQNITWLCVARGIQGVGGGGIISLIQVIMGDITTLEQRAAFAGVFGFTWGLASVIGPLAGGALTDKVSWRWCFFINLPTGGIAFLILLVFLKLNPKPRKTARQLAAEFDFIGLLLVVAAAVLLLVGFSNAASQGWNNATTIACIVVGAVLFVVFGAWEFHTTRLPIVSPRLFKTRTTSLVLLSVFCHGLTFFAATYYLPNFYQTVTGSSALFSGVQMLPFALISSIMSSVSGLVLTRIRAYRPVLWFGFSVMLLGYGLMCKLDETSSRAEQEIYPGIAGLGLGCLFQTPLVALQSAMPLSEMGVTTATMALVRSLSGTIGITLGGTILNSDFAQRAKNIPGLENVIAAGASHLDSRTLRNLQPPELAQAAVSAYAQSIRLIWIVSTPIVGAAFIAVLFVKGYSLKRRVQHAGKAPAEKGDEEKQSDAPDAVATTEEEEEEESDPKTAVASPTKERSPSRSEADVEKQMDTIIATDAARGPAVGAPQPPVSAHEIEKQSS